MKKIFLLCCLLTIVGVIFCQAPEWQWVNRAGSSDAEHLSSVVVDNSGSQYVSGYFNESITFGSITLNSSNSGNNMFIAKSNANGNWLWAKTISGASSSNAFALSLDDLGYLYATGNFQGTGYFDSYPLTASNGGSLYLAKLTTDGSFLWVIKADATNGIAGFSIDCSNDGNICVTGHYDGIASIGNTTLPDNGSNDVFVAKIDNSGNWLWAIGGGGSDSDYASSIAVDSSGNAYVVGYFSSTAVFGSTNLVSNGLSDIFIAKVDLDGSWNWAKRVGGINYDIALAVAVDNDNSAYLTGQFQNTAIFGNTVLTSSNNNADMFVAKIDPLGTWQWAVKSYGAYTETGIDIDVDNLGYVYATGHFRDVVFFGSTLLTSLGYTEPDVFVVKLDSNGNWLWVCRAGGTDVDAGYSICANEGNSIYVAGYFYGMSIFGNSYAMSSGSCDVFVSKLSNPPVINNDDYMNVGSFALSSNNPNPFQTKTMINYSLKDACSVRLEIFNIKGQLIKSLMNETKQAGEYNISWDGTNNWDKKVSAGLYYYRMTSNGKTSTRKMLLIN